MANLTRDVVESAMECSSKNSIPFDQLNTCANDLLGNTLLYESGVRTLGLIPKKNYVPWIVANNKHSKMIQYKAEMFLVEFVCNEYEVSLKKYV